MICAPRSRASVSGSLIEPEFSEDVRRQLDRKADPRMSSKEENAARITDCGIGCGPRWIGRFISTASSTESPGRVLHARPQFASDRRALQKCRSHDKSC